MKRLTTAIILLLMITGAAQAEERWALLVGIDEYSNDIITPLRGAARDAKALQDVLVNQAKFPAENVFCLTSEDKGNLPNLGNIVTKLDFIASEADPGDVFLFFFAGHGVSVDSKNYLLAYESDIRPFLLTKTALSVEELNHYLSKIQSGNTILILDACRNNPRAGRGDEDNLMTESFVKSVENIEFRATIYSCKTGQRAYEWPGKERGIFSLVLEEALSGKADRDGDGQVTLNEAQMHLAEYVPRNARSEVGRSQEPWIDMSGDPRAGNLVLSWASDEQIAEASGNSGRREALSRELVTHQSATGQSLIQHVDITKNPIVEEIQDPRLRPLTDREIAAGWVEAEGECYGASISPEEGQKIALNRARRNAVEMALGTGRHVQRAFIRSIDDFESAFVELSRNDLYGEIVEEMEPLWSSDENVRISSGASSVPLYYAKLRARISRESTKADPGFIVTLRLNNGTFLDGEEMMLSVTPTKDCYITIFNIRSDHSVLVLDASQRKIPGKRTTTLPAPSGESIRVALPEGRMDDMESIIVVATRDDIPFAKGSPEELLPDTSIADGKPVLAILPTYQAALDEISGWLAGIPLERRAFDIQKYRIIKRNQ